jgi:dephospho-CoA kinase
MTFLVGLTGGIGSGKTAVSDHFSELGVPIVDTDVIAREVVEPGQPALKEILEHFGKELLSANGLLDRDTLRNIVFKDPEARRKLEGITHPQIRKRTFELAREANFPYCIIVVPLLVESGYKELVDRVLVVVADRAKRTGWVRNRSGLSTTEIDTIIDSQVDDEDRIAIADDVLLNDSDLPALRKKVDRLHSIYLALAQ